MNSAMDKAYLDIPINKGCSGSEYRYLFAVYFTVSVFEII
jgi:hypothetical protein